MTQKVALTPQWRSTSSISGVFTGSGPSSNVNATAADPVVRWAPLGPTALAAGVVTGTLGNTQSGAGAVSTGAGEGDSGGVSGPSGASSDGLRLGIGVADAAGTEQPVAVSTTAMTIRRRGRMRELPRGS